MTRSLQHQPKSLNLKFFFFEKAVLGRSSRLEILIVYDVIKLENELDNFFILFMQYRIDCKATKTKRMCFRPGGWRGRAGARVHKI